MKQLFPSVLYHVLPRDNRTSELGILPIEKIGPMALEMAPYAPTPRQAWEREMHEANAVRFEIEEDRFFHLKSMLMSDLARAYQRIEYAELQIRILDYLYSCSFPKKLVAHKVVCSDCQIGQAEAGWDVWRHHSGCEWKGNRVAEAVSRIPDDIRYLEWKQALNTAREVALLRSRYRLVNELGRDPWRDDSLPLIIHLLDRAELEIVLPHLNARKQRLLRKHLAEKFPDYECKTKESGEASPGEEEKASSAQAG